MLDCFQAACVSHSRSSHSPQSQESRCKLVANKSTRRAVSFAVLLIVV